jgi:zinc-ribbon family
MFFLHKYGTKQVLLGSYDPYPLQCPECKELATIDITIYGDYYHYWYIPIFPYEKDGYAKCSSCDFTINSVKFNRNTKELFREIKGKFRYPFYTYTGIAIICAPFIIGILAWLFS